MMAHREDGGGAREAEAGACITYVTAIVADQLFGIPIERVHDVFPISQLTPVPLAPPEVAGLLNLRGRIVTAIDVRRRLGLPAAPRAGQTMAIGIEAGPESFGLIVDRIGEIVAPTASSLEEIPVHLDRAWAELSRGVHLVDGGLLVIMNIDAVLDVSTATPSSAIHRN